MLLLGAGESGKSTLFKQMIQIYGKGFPESERKGFTNIIYNNIITRRASSFVPPCSRVMRQHSMKTLVQQSETYGNVANDLRA